MGACLHYTLQLPTLHAADEEGKRRLRDSHHGRVRGVGCPVGWAPDRGDGTLGGV